MRTQKSESFFSLTKFFRTYILSHYFIFRQTTPTEFSICPWTKSYYIKIQFSSGCFLICLHLLVFKQPSCCRVIVSSPDQTMLYLATESHELHCQSFLYCWDCNGLSCKWMINSKRKCLRSWNLYIRSEVPSLWIYSVLPAAQELQVCVVLWPFPFHLLQCLQNMRDREAKLNKKYRM